MTKFLLPNILAKILLLKKITYPPIAYLTHIIASPKTYRKQIFGYSLYLDNRPRWLLYFYLERAEIQSELLFFRMETSDQISLGAIIISIVALLGTAYSLYLQNESHKREKRREEKEKKSEVFSLNIRLTKHSTYKLRRIIIGKPPMLPLNCFFINDGVRIIYLKSLLIEAFENEAWVQIKKINYLNGKPESIIEPGPNKHIKLVAEINPQIVPILEEIKFRVQTETTTGEKFYSNELNLSPTT